MAGSGQWEVVRKKTKQNATIDNNAKNQALLYLEKMPRFVNDYGSLGKESQFEILASNGSRKTKSQSSTKVNAAANEKEENGTVKKAVVPKKSKKRFELETIVKPPKSIDAALKKVNAVELRAIVTMVQTRFVHSSNMWLAELVVFFNSKMNCDAPDSFFVYKDPHYPLSVTSKDVQKIVYETIGKCSEPILKAFFEKTLGEMVSEMAKGVRVNGYRVVLQAMIRHNPSLVENSLVKFGNLRNTYQNRQIICETVLWLASVAGGKSFDVGLKVWLELFLPVIGIKSYSKFVVNYICALFSWQHKDKLNSDALEAQKFFPVLDIVFNNSAKLPSNLHNDLVAIYPKLKKVAFGRSPEKNLRNFFPTFLSRLKTSCPALLKTELLECLLYCLRTDTKCYIAWLQLYTRHLLQSSLLLEHLIENWEAVGPSLPLLKETLGEFNAANAKLSANLKNGVVNGLPQCRQHCKKVLGNMSSGSTNSSKGVRSSSSNAAGRNKGGSDGGDEGFGILRPFVFVLFVVLASALFYDCQIHGGFKDSSTGRILNDYGVVSAYEEASSRVKEFYGTAYAWTITNVPIYVGIVKQHCQPYSKLATEWIATVKGHFIDSLMAVHGYLTTNVPLALEWVDEKFPGVVDTIAFYIVAAWNAFFTCSSATMAYFLHYAQMAGAWLQENVFTGELAMDKLREHLFVAVDTIQAYTENAFNWFGQHLKTDTK